jgi:hypothetical protein
MLDSVDRIDAGDLFHESFIERALQAKVLLNLGHDGGN